MSHPATIAVESSPQRREFLELLWNCYEQARTGHASVVMVVGEPGIGKTYLLTQFATLAAHEGATILQGHASGTEGMRPYLPLLEAVGQYIRTAPADQLRNQAALDLEILTSILPELAARLGISPASSPMPLEQQRWRLYEALGAFLEAISMGHPLLLLLDDLHQADTESLSLLCYIARHHPKAHMLILGTARECEQQQNLAFVRTLSELARYRILTMLRVQLLSLIDVESLALCYLGKPAASAVIVLLYAKSEGNPFFVEELLRCWVETHALRQENEQWVLAASVDNLLPSGIINMLRQQLAQLHPQTIEHLRVAAVIGNVFDISLLAAVEGQEAETVEECLLEAVCSCLILSDQTGNFRFSHRAVYEYLYNDLTTSRRRRLHGCVAQLLEVRYGEEPSRNSNHLAELAHHFARKGDRIQATRYAQYASAQVMREYISHEFEVLSKAPLQCLAVGQKCVDASLPDVNTHVGLRGREEETQPFSTSADRLLSMISDLETMLNLAQELGMVEWWQEMLRAAERVLEQMQALAEKRPSLTDIYLLVEQAMPLVSRIGHQPACQIYARRLLELAHRLPDAPATTGDQP